MVVLFVRWTYSDEAFVVVPSVNIPIRAIFFYKGEEPILRVASLHWCNVCITIGNCLENINNKGWCIMYLQRKSSSPNTRYGEK